MQADPTRNTVVFTLKTEPAPRLGTGTAQDASCVKNVFDALQKSGPIDATQVKEIFADWQPSPEDKAWIDATFPADAVVSFNFKRPATDADWPKALEDAKKALEEAIAQEAAALAASKEQVYLPVLTTFEKEKPLPDTFVTKAVVPGLAVVLARVAPTEHGSLNVHWLTKAELKEAKQEAFTLWKQAWENLEKELKMGANKESDVIMLQHARGLGAGMVAMPGFCEQALGWVKSQRVTIAIPDPSGVLVAASRTPAARQVTIAVEQSSFAGGGAAAFTPCILEFAFGTLKLVFQRGKEQPGK